jgi:hypothetical protein
MVFLLGSACIRLADTIMEFEFIPTTTASLLAVWALENFFIFGVMFSLIFISINPTVKDAINPPRPTPNQPAALAPGGPQMAQGVYGSDLARYSVAVPGQPGMHPAYAYQLQPGQQQQQFYQQQPVYAQAPPPMPQHFAQHHAVPVQEMAHQQFSGYGLPSRDINEAAAEHAVSPTTEKPVELQATIQTELP